MSQAKLVLILWIKSTTNAQIMREIVAKKMFNQLAWFLKDSQYNLRILDLKNRRQHWPLRWQLFNRGYQGSRARLDLWQLEKTVFLLASISQKYMCKTLLQEKRKYQLKFRSMLVPQFKTNHKFYNKTYYKSLQTSHFT